MDQDKVQGFYAKLYGLTIEGYRFNPSNYITQLDIQQFRNTAKVLIEHYGLKPEDIFK